MVWRDILCCLCVILAANAIDATNCPCSHPSLCEPVSTPTTHEGFIFSVTNKNWKKYNWDKVTTVATNYRDRELMCYAHSKKARVVAMAFYPAKNLTNPADRSAWVQEQVQLCKDNFLDGINVDFEDEIDKGQQDLRDGLNALMKELVAAFKSTFKYSQITFDMPSLPDLYGRYYDFKTIGDLMDFLFIMDYDMNGNPKIAWANSPLNQTEYGLKKFMSMGIPSEKLVMGIPWYGYDYRCVNYTQDNICFRSDSTTGGVGRPTRQVSYSIIMETLLPSSTTGRLWDSVAKSPYFTYKEAQTGEVHQVWFDDPFSLLYKFRLDKELGLRGVGMWQADCLDYSADPRAQRETAIMWGVLPTKP